MRSLDLVDVIQRRRLRQVVERPGPMLEQVSGQLLRLRHDRARHPGNSVSDVSSDIHDSCIMKNILSKVKLNCKFSYFERFRDRDRDRDRDRQRYIRTD